MIATLQIERFGLSCPFFRRGGFFSLAQPVKQDVLVGAGLFLGPLPFFSKPVKVYRITHLGPIISSGRTTRSKVSASTKPSAIASSFRVVPFLCAVLATCVALS